MFIDIREPNIPYIIHNKHALVLGEYIMRILELETYHTTDPYTHCNDRQYARTDEGDFLIQPNEGSITSFYLHRTGNRDISSYKGGTYKGLDIASNGGILIRSLLVENEVIEGPSLVVDKLLSLYQGLTMEQLEVSLRLVEYEWEQQATTFYIGARAGLSSPKDLNETWYYISQQRSAIIIPKKYKDTFFTCNIDRTDIPYKTKRYIEEYKQGQELIEFRTGLTQLQVAGYLYHNSV